MKSGVQNCREELGYVKAHRQKIRNWVDVGAAVTFSSFEHFFRETALEIPISLIKNSKKNKKLWDPKVRRFWWMDLNT